MIARQLIDHEKSEVMRHISLKELKAKLTRGDKFILVNALDEAKFNSMHIPGSVNLFTKDDIKTYLRPDDEIVVYCTEAACNRSILLYYLLETMGYRNIQRYAGGLKEWVEDGNPISRRMAWNIVPMYPETQMRIAQ
jgi:rhodanese-related sulfurtransferase